MSVMALEVLGTNLNNTIRLATILTSFIACSSSGNLPDPVTDPILGIFYCFQSAIDPDDRRASYIRGIIAVRSTTVREARLGMQGFAIIFAKVLSQIFCCILAVSLSSIVSRVIDSGARSYGAPSDWSRNHETMFRTTGRHVLNLRSIFRSEHSFTSYTFENNVFQILQRRYAPVSN